MRGLSANCQPDESWNHLGDGHLGKHVDNILITPIDVGRSVLAQAGIILVLGKVSGGLSYLHCSPSASYWGQIRSCDLKLLVL